MVGGEVVWELEEGGEVVGGEVVWELEEGGEVVWWLEEEAGGKEGGAGGSK